MSAPGSSGDSRPPRAVMHPFPFDLRQAQNTFSTLNAKAAGIPALAATISGLTEPEAGSSREFLAGVFGCSPYLASLAVRHPDTLAAFFSAGPDSVISAALSSLDEAIASATTQPQTMQALRQVKNRIALAIALADLSGDWDVVRTTAALSAAADRLVSAACGFLLAQAAKHGLIELADPQRPGEGSGYIILAMGKHGAHELNYSSDIDLIVFYDPAIAPLKPGTETGQFFVRLTRDLVKLMQERTADGYVFRTDLRLRPDPASTQIALSTGAAFHYYESAGQNWERAAYIKARAIAGDIAAGETFLKQLEPYVWRKYLDYAAIADIHAMKRQIHAHKGHAEITVAGHNLKLGRGGIREIEFFVQTQQLIAGGRQPDLRVRGTLEALDKLAARGWITSEAATQLGEAYRFLRQIEHRLQMLNDEQTHTLPADEAALRRIANFSGYADYDSFAAALAAQFRTVERHYARLFEDVPELTAPTRSGSLVFTGVMDDPATLATLAGMGFTYPASVAATVRGWHFGRYPAMRSGKARERLTEVTPALLTALSNTSNPDQALASFDAFLAELPAGVQLFSMLRNKPALLQLIADIAGSAPRLARVLTRSRRILDAVLDPGMLDDMPDRAALERYLAQELEAIPDYEDALNRARVIGQEQAFLIGVRVLSGAIAPENAGQPYALLAECLIAALQEQVERLLHCTHGRIPGGEAAVIAMGKLGGREMTAASDLDLILIYNFERPDILSSGLKPLPAGLYYTRFTQRLISALSSHTSEGKLYDVDMRLRPSGNSGPVATSLASFTDYQENRAWTWEHMALTRARVVSGPPRLRDELESVISRVLTRPRDAHKIAADVREMRAKIMTHKGTKDIWDLKQARGGLVDIEFIAQYLQLVHAAETPSVLDVNTAHALSALAGAGYLAASDADVLTAAARLYNALTQVLRLCVEGRFDPAKAPAGLKERLAKAGRSPDFESLQAELIQRQRDVAQVFEALLGQRDP